MAEKPKTELVKLNGTIIRSDGTSIKTDYFKFLELDLDDYSDVSYTPQEAAKIRMHMSHLSTGAAAAVPLICPGEVRCPFSRSCPMVRVDQARRLDYENSVARGDSPERPKMTTPVGKQCCVEKNLMNEWTRLYVTEFDVPENSFVELGMCRELAEIELMMWRLNNNLAKAENAELVQETVVGVDKEGNALTRKEENSFFVARERLQKRKSQLFKAMVGDRQEKYKKESALKQRQDADPSKNAAALRSEVTRLLKQAEHKVLEIQEAEGNVIDVGQETTESEFTPESLINSLERD